MVAHFKTELQETLFRRVLGEFHLLGYGGDLLRENYEFPNLFDPNRPLVEAPAVVFGRTPLDQNSACFAVLISNDASGPELVAKYRALGAVGAFEIGEDSVRRWRISATPSSADLCAVIRPGELEWTFRENAHLWSPKSILRAKNIIAPGPKQKSLDFVDPELLPAIESHVREQLDPLLREILSEAKADYEKRNDDQPDGDKLFRLLFRTLTGKVMHDRGLKKFAGIDGPSDPVEFLRAVAEHYQDPKPIISDKTTQKIVVERLWNGMNFKNLSIEVLTFVWENTLVTDDIRVSGGIHATPASVARYVAQRLIDVAPETRERIVEPCCGSGTFLIAAISQLRDILGQQMDPRKRHEYFAKIMVGFDIESFGLEVAHSCLTLADFPNPNGWRLVNEDVFGTPLESPDFTSSLGKARFVVCNPPFEAFSDDEREEYDYTFVQRPAEMLSRVLESIPRDCEIGFVLPLSVIDGRAFRPLRRRLAEQFSHIEVVHLPEGVFKRAKFPSVLLIAKQPYTGRETVSLQYSFVKEANDFVFSGIIDETSTLTRSITDIEATLGVVQYGDLWEYLAEFPRLSSAVDDIARGVEWHNFKKARHISDKPLRGFLPGFHTADDMYCFESPPIAFLSAKHEDRRRNAWNKPWHLPKVVCNAVRKSSGPWRISACPVELNLICSQNFHVLWPKSPWTARSLSAVLNGPVACAFVAASERWKHLKNRTLRQIPLPQLGASQIAAVDALVEEYQQLAALRRDYPVEQGLFTNTQSDAPSEESLTRILQRIDRIILSGYKLPSHLQQQLQNIFQDSSRPTSIRYGIDAIFESHDSMASQDKQEAASWEMLVKTMQDEHP